MPQRRRRGRRNSGRRNTIIAAIAIVVIVVAIGAYLALGQAKSSSTTSSGTGSSTSSGGTDDYAVVDTSQGTFVIQLYPQDAPKTVANFVSLANSGFYNDLVWHRIVQGFVIQTGDPTTKNGGGNESTWGQTGSGTTIPFESNNLPNDAGYVAMANTVAKGNGASSQFFINLVNNTSLNGDYTVFGQVISGMSVVDAIANLPVSSQCSSSGGLTCPPLAPTNAEILSITIQSSP